MVSVSSYCSGVKYICRRSIGYNGELTRRAATANPATALHTNFRCLKIARQTCWAPRLSSRRSESFSPFSLSSRMCILASTITNDIQLLLRTLILPLHKTPHLQTLPLRSMIFRRNKRCVRTPSRHTLRLRIKDLQQQNLLRPHLRRIEPLMLV